jgi:predicted outer membrane repeat protein
VSIDNCKFVNNKAKEYGGALFILRAHLTVQNSLFEKNTVTSSKSAGHAGAIWLSASSSKITKTTFKKNTCISKSLKSHSKATKYKFNGGAVSYHQGSSHVLSDCKFSGNKASNHGGAIFSFKSKLKINKIAILKSIVAGIVPFSAAEKFLSYIFLMLVNV